MPRLILEGPDLVGKSTAARLLLPIMDVQDRLMPFTEAITHEGIDRPALDAAVDSIGDAFLLILCIRNDSILERRLALRNNPDEFDKKCVAYNQQYREAARYLGHRKNVEWLPVDYLSKFDKCGRIVERYLHYLHPNELAYSIPPELGE